MHNSLTVDVEEWFHVCGAGDVVAPDKWSQLPSRVIANTRDLLVLLDRHGVRATFFVLGWVAMRYPRLVEEILTAGHEIASHGHAHRRVYELTPQQFADDVDAGVSFLRAAGAKDIIGFRAPEWSINDRSIWALDVLARKQFRFDSSMAPLRIIGNPAYPRVPHIRATSAGELTEFPPLVGRRLGQNIPLGGGWGLRMSAPTDVLRAIERSNRARQPVALWVHPWEIDPDPPRARLPWPQRFAHYFRLDGFKQRLEEVIKGAPFCPMGEVLGVAKAR